jgi:hypothetical protein
MTDSENIDSNGPESLDTDYIKMASQWSGKMEEMREENQQLRLSIIDLEREKDTLQERLEKAEYQAKAREAERDQAIKVQMNREWQLRKISEEHSLETQELQERIAFLERKLESVETGKELQERIDYLEQQLVSRETEVRLLRQQKEQRNGAELSTEKELSTFSNRKSEEMEMQRLLLEKSELERSLNDIRGDSMRKDREISRLSRSLEEMDRELELMKNILQSPAVAKPESPQTSRQGNIRKSISKRLSWISNRVGGGGGGAGGGAHKSSTLDLTASVDMGSQPITRGLLRTEQIASRMRHARSLDLLSLPPPPTTLRIQWNKKSSIKAPTNRIVRGAAVIDKSVVYFSSHLNSSIWGYNSAQEQWFAVTDCPNVFFALAMVDGCLTVIGGQRSHGSMEPTNELLSLMEAGGEHEMWVELNSPMPTKRTNATAVTTESVLIVAGGTNAKKLDVVEIMNLANKQWSVAMSLPKRVESLSSAYCPATDHVFLMGGDEDGGKAMNAVLICSVEKLLHSCARFNRIRDSSEVWETLSELNVSHPTCVVVQDHLLALGGIEQGQQKTDSRAVYDYDFSSKSWKPVVMLPSPTHKLLAAVLPSNRLMVVGGFTKVNILDKVYFADIIFE